MRRSFFLIVLALTTAGAACSSSDDNASAPVTDEDGGGSSSGSSGSGPGPDGGGGSPEASTDAAGGDGGDAGVDPCKDRTICDSFESFAVGTKPGAPWKPLESNGTVTISDTRAHTGTHSVKLVTNGGTQYQEAMIQTSGAPLFPAANNTLYGKMYIWVEVAADHNVHWNILSASGLLPAPHATTTAFFDYGGQLDLLLALFDTSGGSVNTDCSSHSKQGIPIGKWACYAWAQKGPTNEMQLFDEKGQIADMHIVGMADSCLNHDLNDKWIAPTFTSTKVGWESVQTETARTVYIDDVTFDDQPLSCP